MTDNRQNLLAPSASEAPIPAPAPSADTVAALQAKLDEAHAQIALLTGAKRDLETTVTKLTAVQLQQSEDEKLIADKMSKGLTRPQAIAVIRRQRQWDESDHGKMMKARHEQAQRR